MNSNALKKNDGIKHCNISSITRRRFSEDFTHDIFNHYNYYIGKSYYDNCRKSIDVVRNYLQEQLNDIHNEKRYIGRLLQKYLKQINKKECLLLDFIITHRNEIIKLRERRRSYGTNTINELVRVLRQGQHQEAVIFKIKATPHQKKLRKLELFFSSCRIKDNQYYIFERVAPVGVLSSRYEYISSVRRKLKCVGGVDPLEVIFRPLDSKWFHAFR